MAPTTTKTDEFQVPNDDFRSLFETHPSPMWVYDPRTLRFLIVNNAAHDLYGYSAEQFRKMTVLDIRPPAERERMMTAVQGRTDIERAERWTHLKATGEAFEVLTYGREVRFDGGDAILAIVQDRTEVNAARRQVTDTRSLLDSIARKHNAAPSQIALAWVLKRSPVMLPIPGTSKVKHLEENVAAVGIQLSDEEFSALDKAGRKEAGVG